MKKCIQQAVWYVICLYGVVLECDTARQNGTGQKSVCPVGNLTEEHILYENKEYNNCNQKAIYSEINKEIYSVFTRVSPAFDSTSIMFAVLDTSGTVIRAPQPIGAVKSISSFPNIVQSGGRIFVTWHGNATESATKGFTAVELSRDGNIGKKMTCVAALPATFKGDALLADETSLFHFYNTEIEEDVSGIAYIRIAIKGGLKSEDSAIIRNCSCLLHHAYWDNGSIYVVFTQEGALITAAFDQKSKSVANLVQLESIDCLDPVVSFSPLPDGATVAAYSNTSTNLSLQFYSSKGNRAQKVHISSNAYNFSNIIVRDSIASIAWVTDNNNVACTLYSLVSSQLCKIEQINNSTTGIAIEPFLLSVPHGIFIFWRDCRNHNGGDIYFRRVIETDG